MITTVQDLINVLERYPKDKEVILIVKGEISDFDNGISFCNMPSCIVLADRSYIGMDVVNK